MIQPIIDSNNNGYFVARAGEDRSITTGETVLLQASFAENQRNNNFKWRFISKPDNSQAVLSNTGQANASFLTDQNGIYKIELGMFFEKYSTYDTVNISAFTISNLEGNYQVPTLGANGVIRQFLVFQNKLYAAGDFTLIGGVEAPGLASFNGSQWSTVGKGLQQQRMYSMVDYQDKLYVSGSYREPGGKDIFNFAYWDGETWKNIGFAKDGTDMVVFQEMLYLNFGDKLARWDGANLTEISISQVESITYLETANNLLYLRGLSGENCTNSSVDMWVYNCEANGFLLQFDGINWAEVAIENSPNCIHTGNIKWDYHVWIVSDPGFEWNFMEAYQDKLYFPCGYSENGHFKEFAYPFERIYKVQAGGSNSLYVTGLNLKTEKDYSGLMKWDGEQWFSLGEGIEGRVNAIQEFQNKIYIGGRFDQAGGQQTANMAIWSDN